MYETCPIRSMRKSSSSIPTWICIPLIDEAIELLQKDAEYFNCVDELKHLHTIIKQGTSAHRQVATYINALDSNKDHDEALRLVVDHLIEETLIGI